jgi:hypothetical protein
MSQESAEHHTKAAEHHEHAARHHKEAAMKRPGIMPTSRMVTTCMPLIMRKKPQSITPKTTVPSKNSA